MTTRRGFLARLAGAAAAVVAGKMGLDRLTPAPTATPTYDIIVDGINSETTTIWVKDGDYVLEVAQWHRALTPAERQAVLQEMTTRWGLA